MQTIIIAETCCEFNQSKKFYLPPLLRVESFRIYFQLGFECLTMLKV